MNTIENKVVWSDGLFLLPQHFQQQERYLESLSSAPLSMHPFPWGVSSILLDRSQLLQGVLALRSGEGIFPDGTPFQFPVGQSTPMPLLLPHSRQSFYVYLGLPKALVSTQSVGQSTSQSGGGSQSELDPSCRYRISQEAIADNVTDSQKKVEVQTAVQNCQLFVDETDIGLSAHDHSSVQSIKDYTAIPVAYIKETDQNGCAVLDDNYWVPAIALQANPQCVELLQEIGSLLQHRGQELSARQSQMSGVSAGMVDFMMLLTVNRYLPIFHHLRKLPNCHPEVCYRTLAMLAGELATFGNENKLAAPFSGYQHEQLAACYLELATQIRKTLRGVIELPSLEVPFQEVKPGFWQADILDASLLETDWILAVKAEMPAAALREQIRDGVRLSAAEKINDIIRLGIPGIPLNELPVPPSEVKVYQDHLYYQLERKTDQWPSAQTSPGFAMKVIGRLPGLTLTLWSISRGV